MAIGDIRMTKNTNLTLLSADVKKNSDDWHKNLGKSKLDLSTPRNNNWWTGKAPENNKIISLPSPNLVTCTRQDVLDFFDNTWTLTEVLFSSLKNEEAFYRPPYHGLRHPLVFYYIHPAVLYVNKLRLAQIISSPINEYYEYLFETGVDEMSWDDMSKNSFDWPSLDELHDYRKAVYKTIKNVILTHEELKNNHAPINQESPLWALFMAMEHERIHLETSSVLIRELPIHLVDKPKAWPNIYPIINTNNYPIEDVDYPKHKFIHVKNGQIILGKSKGYPTYGWDNEYGKREENISDFYASSYLINNGQFFQFVIEGGYQEKEYWTKAGWDWKHFRNAKHPTFWHLNGPAGSNNYLLRTCFEIVPMQWSWPAIINYHEANAYCNWLSKKENTGKNYRLISEAEHHRLRQIVEANNIEYNLNLHYGSESPVNNLALSNTICDLYGNVWQWCLDHFNALPGFRIHKYYDDFSTPCFDGKHQMIIGGSFASTGDEASYWARYHFRPHFFQHAGMRIVFSNNNNNGNAFYIGQSKESQNPYEKEETLNEYLTLHYGSNQIQMPFDLGAKDGINFPQNCAEILVNWSKKLDIDTESMLEIGCAVGGASFYLANHFQHVEAIDLSEQFINTAKMIQETGKINFSVKEEGKIYSKQTSFISLKYKDRINFRRADACSLPPEYTNFDAVLIANVLCRLPSPMACLSRLMGMRSILKDKGLLVIASPFTWMDKFTPEDVWLGGYIGKDGKTEYSEDNLVKILSNEFKLLDKINIPFILREHKRKYQYIISLITIWQRK
jgi:5-histidylcysteine sulfoxide synthase/putative 4-mercaptohistidine N1-methyltranferase